ncbi:MAG: ABC transporter substrate-binding protein [Albimonas sp.]|uniref:ABC transporter substrate-binding protein n=1 Tax=Albimonas sp. TaxID=1872425 RepID=UPI004055A3B1
MTRTNAPTPSRRQVLAAVGAATAVSALGAPFVARGQAAKIRVGMPTILSGRVAILGTSSRDAAILAVNKFNAAGGFGGREVELVVRDSKGQPDEAARVTRDLVNTEGCELIIDAEASSGSFAVHEVVGELGVLCLHTCSETSALTADPKLHKPTAFRSARQGIHDAVAGGKYAADIAKRDGLMKWMTCSPDYAYGRDNTAQFVEYLKIFAPEVEVVNEAWPKLFEPDYTAYVTRVLQVQPDAIYSALWGGDLVSFLEQANLYQIFANGLQWFSGGLADPPIVNALKQLPSGLHSVFRYDPEYPDSEANKAFHQGFTEISETEPTNWAWQTYTAVQFIDQALQATGGKTDGQALADAIKGAKVESPFTETGEITMRESDHTIIGYPVAWGQSRPDPKGFQNWERGDWDEILSMEAEWKKRQGYA